MYRCKSWIIKKAEHQRNDAFELWCWRKTLESPSDSKEIKPVNPKRNQPWIHWKDWCWSWSSNTLLTWCKKPTHWKKPWMWERVVNLLEKTLILGRPTAGGERRWLRMKWLDGITHSMDMNLSKFWEIVKDKDAWCTAVYVVSKRQTQLSDKTK